MRRHWAFALLAVAALPCMAQAQGESSWGPLVRVTPTIGFSPGFKQSGAAEIVTSTTVGPHRYRMEYPNSLPIGANLELRFWNRFSVIAGGAWSARGDGEITDLETNVTHPTAGTDFWLAKAGLAVRLREVQPDIQMSQLNASVFVAPALIRDAGKTALFAPVTAATTAEHFGLNIGAEGELPLASRYLAFTVGLEDWMIFWNHDDYITRIAAYLEEGSAQQTVLSIDPDRSHLWVLRVGLTFRF
jgi:hypothetical protein